MNHTKYSFYILYNTDKYKVLSVLYNLDINTINKNQNKKIEEKYNNEIVNGYFRDKFFGLGCYYSGKMIGYCFIKYPMIRPETMTVVHKDYRNCGIATAMRNEILKYRNHFYGNIVYSAVELNNPASLKSLLKSNYEVFDVTKDGFIQLIKILPYKK